MFTIIGKIAIGIAAYFLAWGIAIYGIILPVYASDRRPRQESRRQAIHRHLENARDDVQLILLRVFRPHRVLIFEANLDGMIKSIEWGDERNLPVDSFQQPHDAPSRRTPNKKCGDFAADPSGVWPSDCGAQR